MRLGLGDMRFGGGGYEIWGGGGGRRGGDIWGWEWVYYE